MLVVMYLLTGLIAMVTWTSAAALTTTFATVTLEFSVPIYLDFRASVETHESGGTVLPGASIIITTNESDWALVAGLDAQAVLSLASPTAARRDVAVEVDVADYDLQGTPSIAENISWRADELRRTFTVVDRGSAGPFQRLRFAYRFHPMLMEAYEGPFRFVYTVVR